MCHEDLATWEVPVNWSYYILPYSWLFSRYLNSAVFADMERSVKFKSLKTHFVYSIYGAAEMIRENKNAKN